MDVLLLCMVGLAFLGCTAMGIAIRSLSRALSARQHTMTGVLLAVDEERHKLVVALTEGDPPAPTGFSLLPGTVLILDAEQKSLSTLPQGARVEISCGRVEKLLVLREIQVRERSSSEPIPSVLGPK